MPRSRRSESKSSAIEERRPKIWKRDSPVAPLRRVARDERQEFVDRVKAIDPVFRRGDLDAFWPSLRELIAFAPRRADLSKKKSHYLASLAARSLARGDPNSALEFLAYAERTLDASHLTPFLLEERADYRLQAQEAIRLTSGAR